MQPTRVRKIGYRKEKRSRLNLLQSLFFILLTVGAGYLFLQSNFFAISKIVVNGNKLLSADEIKKLAAIPLAANIFKVDINQAQERVKTDPIVKQVQIKRKFPSTVEVDIQERHPLGLIPYNTKFLQVDVEGYCLAQVDNTNRTDLPMITGIQVNKVQIGKSLNYPGLSGAMKYLDLMQTHFASLMSRISEINVADADNIKLYTVDNIEVRLGDDIKAENKLKLLDTFFTQKYNKPIEYVDVSYDDEKITTKFVEQGEEN